MDRSSDDIDTAAISIRLLRQDDEALPHLAALMEEMQAHYDVPCPTRADLLAGLGSRPPGAEIFVAVKREHVIAFCAFSAIYPGPGLKPGIFLKEIYVGKAHRSLGLGRVLMSELAAFAGREGFSRIDWTADANDARLLAFYDGIGGERKPEKLFYRLDGEALAALGRDLPPRETTSSALWQEFADNSSLYEDIQPEMVTVSEPAKEMIFASLFTRNGPADDSVSFLILGMSAKSVMEDVVGAGTYEALDPEFLRHEVGIDGQAIEVVSFGTSEGPGVELRVPVADARAAIAVLARHISPAFAGRVCYVAEIRDVEEVFVVRVIGEAGTLGEARRVRLV